MPVEVRQFSITGFFQGRPRPRFTAGLAGLVSLRGTSGVGKGASSLSSSAGTSSSSGLAGASSLFGLAGASSLSSLMVQVFLDQKQGFIDVLLKLVSLLGRYTQYILSSMASKQ